MATQWGEGYVTDLEYTAGYYRELNPSLLRFACLHGGIQPPPAGPLNYLELGFGQGLSLNIHAAACPGTYWGTDFNPSHTARAAQFTDPQDGSIRLLNDSFAELQARSDLPDFDVIALHGVWSWISDANRRAIVDIARRKLKVGGILSVSYNCDPGWAALQPLRHLMYLHTRMNTAPAGGRAASVDQALAFSSKLEKAGALYFRNNPQVGPFLQAISAMDRKYLVHEYLGEDWQPMAFSQVVDWLAPARVEFAASANLLDQVENLMLNPAGRQLVAEAGNRVLRETIRDYLVHQRFRRDIFVKGLRPLSAVDRLEQLDRQSIVLKTLPSQVPSKIAGPFFEANLQPDVYGLLVEALASDGHAPKTIADLRARGAARNVSAAHIVEGVAMLIGMDHAVPAEAATAESRRRCAALNRALCERARRGDEFPCLASPVAGTGIEVSRLQQCFLLALANGATDAVAVARDVWAMLSAMGQSVLKDGKGLEGAEANLAELEQQAAAFQSQRLPLLKSLGVSLA
ncbi:class I SAM-dependent methyltransferase [Reyranella sp.]|uniref:class I SAM-dependent methyltransferase n=1 Tax=Reyranella sp. TaxID=1929291 RepID=UPI003BAA113E